MWYGDDSTNDAFLYTNLRVSPEIYESMKDIPLHHGRMEYNDVARIVTMIPSSLDKLKNEGDLAVISKSQIPTKRVIVATAGTTDLPVAEETAVTLEAAGCVVERINDVGVAGLHRILKALPRLQDPDVGCIIVCAGMDGALPSVVGGLVSVPVVAVPTRYVEELSVFSNNFMFKFSS
jgi:NCAIR mutase (PurE)-related protein